MVTRAGKKLLKNTIRTIDYHNRVLEEQDMWRQWELQQGLTMMVSDDAINSHSKYLRMDIENHAQKLRSKYKECIDFDLQNQDVKSLKKMRNYWLNKLVEAEEQDPDRWGHSGYKELYPEDFDKPSSSKLNNGRCSKKKKTKKKKKIKKKISKKKSSSSNSKLDDSETEDSSSSSTISSSSEIRKRLKQKSISDTILTTRENNKKFKNCINKEKYSKKVKSHETVNKRKKDKRKKCKRKLKSDDCSEEFIWVEKTADGS